MTVSIKQHLLELTADVVKDLARQLGVLAQGMTRKEPIADAVEAAILRDLPRFVARLTAPERLLLAESAHQGRLISGREFTARFGEPSPLAQPAPRPHHGRSLLAALIYSPRYGWQTGEGPQLVTAVIEPLRALLPRPEMRPPETLVELPAEYVIEDEQRPLQVFESERLAPIELGRVLRLVQAGKIKVTDSTQRPTDGATRLIGEVLVTPDFALEPPPKEVNKWTNHSGPVRAHSWGVVVQQCGWAKPRAGVLTLTPDGRELLESFSPEKFRAGVERYLENADFDELHRVNHLRGQTGKAKRWISDPGRRKSVVAEVMADFPVGQWLAFTEARRLINASGAEWNVMESDRGFLYLCEAQYGAIYEHAGVNSQYLRAFFFESLATLGLLDVAYVYPHHLWPELGDNWGVDSLSFCGRYDGLLYVRLNPLGAFCLDATEHYEVVPASRPKLFQVLPSLEIVLAGPVLDAADRATLELLASPRTETVWTVDAGRILTHVETGGSLEALEQFLTTNADGELPESVPGFFEDLAARLRACRGVSAAVLVEWQDEGLARFIAGSPGLEKLCHHAGEGRLVVPQTQVATFRRAVRKLGFLVPGPG